MPTFLYLVWLLLIVNQNFYFGCQEINGTEYIRYTKIKSRFEPALWSRSWKQQSNFFTKHSSSRWGTIQLNVVVKSIQASLQNNAVSMVPLNVPLAEIFLQYRDKSLVFTEDISQRVRVRSLSTKCASRLKKKNYKKTPMRIRQWWFTVKFSSGNKGLVINKIMSEC